MLVESICWWYHLCDNLLLYKYKFTEYFGGLLQSVFAVPALIMRIARCLEVIMAVAVVSWWLYLHIALHRLAQLLLSLSTSWAKVMLTGGQGGQEGQGGERTRRKRRTKSTRSIRQGRQGGWGGQSRQGEHWSEWPRGWRGELMKQGNFYSFLLKLLCCFL